MLTHILSLVKMFLPEEEKVSTDFIKQMIFEEKKAITWSEELVVLQNP